METDSQPDFSNLSAVFINTTLTRSPEVSHTQHLIDISASIMAKQGVQVDQFRSVDHAIATGVYPDMREHGWASRSCRQAEDGNGCRMITFITDSGAFPTS
jgi:hypothetical protein